MAFEPAAEKLNQRLWPTTFFSEHTWSKGLRDAGASPGFREHLNLRHCAVRVVGFASPAKRNPASFIAECNTLTFQGGGTAAGWSLNRPMAAVLDALGTDKAAQGQTALVPGADGLMETVEALLDAVANKPKLGAALEGAGLSLDVKQVPEPFGMTAVFRLEHDGADIQWIYRKRLKPQRLDKKVCITGMVIRSTRIPSAVFVGYADLWRDSMQHFNQKAA